MISIHAGVICRTKSVCERKHVEHVYLSVCLCVFGMILRLVAGTLVIAVSHTVKTWGKLEALQSEFVAVAVK